MPVQFSSADNLAAALTARLDRSVLTPPSLPGWRLSASALESRLQRPAVLWYAPAQLDIGPRGLAALPAEEALLEVIGHQPLRGATAEAIAENAVVVGLVGLPRSSADVLAARTGLSHDWLAASAGSEIDWLMLELLEALVVAADPGLRGGTPGARLRQEAEAGMLYRELVGTGAVLAEQYAARVLSFIHDESLPLSMESSERDFAALRRTLFAQAHGRDPASCVTAAKRLVNADTVPATMRDFLTDYIAAAGLLVPAAV